MSRELTRRTVFAGAAALVAAAAVPLPAITAVAPETDYSTMDWWEKCELRAFEQAFSGLKDSRFDAVVEH